MKYYLMCTIFAVSLCSTMTSCSDAGKPNSEIPALVSMTPLASSSSNTATPTATATPSPMKICPPKLKLYNEIMCVTSDDINAIGPFTAAMIAKCVVVGGGKACNTTQWNTKFAWSLRGSQECPLGATRDGTCNEGEYAFGPFTSEQVTKCMDFGWGEQCKNALRLPKIAFIQKMQDIGKKTIEKYLVEQAELLIKEDKGLGYNAAQFGHTRDLHYNGTKFYTATKRTSHCVGFTYQVLIQAINSWYKDNGNKSVWNLPLSYVQWEPFKHCWYVDSKIKCYGGADALVKYGMGKKVASFEQLQAGDFLNYDRADGSGHSVMFLGFYAGKNGKGFRYASSQGSTGGVALKTAFFDGQCDTSVAVRDCGIKKNSLVMGRVSDPASFVRQPMKLSIDPEVNHQDIQINIDWADDRNAANLP